LSACSFGEKKFNDNLFPIATNSSDISLSTKTATPETTTIPTPKQKIQTRDTNDNGQVDCIGPDGKHFEATDAECKKFNNAWATLTPTQIVTLSTDKEGVYMACISEDRYLDQIKDECGWLPFPGVDECIKFRSGLAEVECKESNYLNASGMTEVECKESNLARANKIEELKPLYLREKAICGK